MSNDQKKYRLFDALKVKSSTLPTTLNAIEGDLYRPSIKFRNEYEELIGNLHTHRSTLIQSSENLHSAQPIRYVRVRQNTHASTNDSDSIALNARMYYQKVEQQLLALYNDDDEEPEVEKGAVSSAMRVVDQLRAHNLAPPVLSWHGGDAVVMLWAIADTTCAITVTEGLLGYVIMQDRQPIREAHSISVDAFRLMGIE